MKLTTDKSIFFFDKTNQPAVKVDAPAVMEIETKDCFSNQLRNPEDTMDALNWDETNPATGPVYVNGAEPGDTLKVTIEKMELDEKGTVCCVENEGTLGEKLQGAHIKIVAVKDGYALYTDDIKIPLNPMIGVIGVAPAGEAVNAGTPGEHGGNMDNTMITEGAVLYFPVAAEGALFALGDVHACMGDGEVGVSGLEIPARITVKLELIKGKAPLYPMLENDDSFSVIVSRKTTDEAAKVATALMEEFLEERTDLTTPEIVMLMSLVGNVEVCQIVDPLKTMRFVFPKKYMKKPFYEI